MPMSLCRRGVWVLFAGYGVCASLDNRGRQKAKERVFDDEIYGWEPDPLEPSEECKDGLNRLKLTGQQQILASRVGQLLRRML